MVNSLVEEMMADIQQHAQQVNNFPLVLDEHNWQQFYTRLTIDTTKNYGGDDVCLEVLDGGGPCRLGSLGNFSAVIGKAKSRKTFFVSFVLSFAVGGNNGYSKIRCRLPGDKQKVILFDTEQSACDASVVAKRVLAAAKMPASPNFEMVAARILSPAERLVLLENIIYNNPTLGILVIDGLRDLVRDINNPDEATEITGKLLKWSDERRIHIIVVLHQNKGDNNARGHLGTEVINKAETVVSVQKEGDLSIVKAEYCRGKPFDNFAFNINGDGLPYPLEEWVAVKEEAKDRKRITPYDYPESAHKEIIREVFTLAPTLKYSNLIEQVRLAFDKRGKQLGENRTRGFLLHYCNNNWICKIREAGRSYDVYTISK